LIFIDLALSLFQQEVSFVFDFGNRLKMVLKKPFFIQKRVKNKFSAVDATTEEI